MSSAVERLFARDASLWTSSGEDAWLGWIDAIGDAVAGRDELLAWARPLGDSFARIVLCGMGGSSLAPLVIGELNDADRLVVVDSTDPAAIRKVLIDGSLFVIASKSGSTMEPNCFADAFWGATGGDGSRFVAITDPGSALEARATQDGWAKIAHGRADVGGRYSAMSAFGLVPSALAGVDVSTLIASAAAMLEACRADNGPGAVLADFIADAYGAGRDKLTIITSPGLETVGLWLEQLVAESTGKQGVGVLPVAGEPIAAPERYGNDRVFVHLRLDSTHDAATAALHGAGHPVLTIPFLPQELGGLFVQWEVATALVGARLGINPFDQPNVQAAKDLAVKLLDDFVATGRLPDVDAGSLESVLAAIVPGKSYLCLQAFVDPTDERADLLSELQGTLRDRYGCAVTAGFGPRYLHSTGQLHKGGPPTGVFVQLLAADEDDEPIPGRQFGFRTLRDAQAIGDCQALRDHDLPVARIPFAAAERLLG